MKNPFDALAGNSVAKTDALFHQDSGEEDAHPFNEIAYED